MKVLPLALLLLLAADWNGSAVSLKKRDLPDDFPLLIFHAGFAVIEVELRNDSQEDWTFDPDSFELRSPKGKRLKQAMIPNILPKLVQSRTSTGPANLNGAIQIDDQEARRAPQPGVDPSRTTPPRRSGPPGDSGSVSVDHVRKIRDALESHRLTPATLKPGERRTGFLYFKSKRSGARLRGAELRLNEALVLAVDTK